MKGTKRNQETNQPYKMRLTMPDATVVELSWKTLRGKVLMSVEILRLFEII